LSLDCEGGKRVASLSKKILLSEKGKGGQFIGGKPARKGFYERSFNIVSQMSGKKKKSSFEKEKEKLITELLSPPRTSSGKLTDMGLSLGGGT